MRFYYIIACVFIIPATVRAQVIESEPWEPQDIYSAAPVSHTGNTGTSFLSPIGNFLISAYQDNARTTSQSRCPFYISCSRFAKESIAVYGIFGAFMFIDRYFYREHTAMRLYYSYRATPGGILKLDDEDYRHLCE